MPVISGNHFHHNNDGDRDGNGDKTSGDVVGIGMLVHPRVTL